MRHFELLVKHMRKEKQLTQNNQCGLFLSVRRQKLNLIEQKTNTRVIVTV